MAYSSSPEELKELVNRGLGTLNMAPKEDGPAPGGRNPNIKYS
jgi:hypothetical protein